MHAIVLDIVCTRPISATVCLTAAELYPIRNAQAVACPANTTQPLFSKTVFHRTAFRAGSHNVTAYICAWLGLDAGELNMQAAWQERKLYSALTWQHVSIFFQRTCLTLLFLHAVEAANTFCSSHAPTMHAGVFDTPPTPPQVCPHPVLEIWGPEHCSCILMFLAGKTGYSSECIAVHAVSSHGRH